MQFLPCRQQGFHDLKQLRTIVNEFADAIIKANSSNNTDLEPEIAQQSANIVLDSIAFS